jgi:hypothetical protein
MDIIAWALMILLEKERKEEARQRAGRLYILRLKEKVDILKVMIKWLKREGDKATPKNKDGLLLQYRETRNCVVITVTYHEDDEEAIATGNGDPAIHVAVEPVGGVVAAVTVGTVDDSTAADVGVGVGVGVVVYTSAVAPVGVLWSLT